MALKRSPRTSVNSLPISTLETNLSEIHIETQKSSQKSARCLPFRSGPNDLDFIGRLQSSHSVSFNDLQNFMKNLDVGTLSQFNIVKILDVFYFQIYIKPFTFESTSVHDPHETRISYT